MQNLKITFHQIISKVECSKHIYDFIQTVFPEDNRDRNSKDYSSKLNLISKVMNCFREPHKKALFKEIMQKILFPQFENSLN